MAEPTSPSPRAGPLLPIAGGVMVGLIVVGAWLDRATGWVATAFDAIAHQFYEVPALAAIRRPSQLDLVRAHLPIVATLVAVGLLLGNRLSRQGRLAWLVVAAAYAIRAAIWIAGGNLPLVPGDSSHYIEVATSVYRGEGAVKHYVESYFRDYPRIRQGRGVLDDWATPLWAYTLAGAYRLSGVVPGRSLEATVAVAKGTSFALNLLCLPALYLFARRRFDPSIALGSMAVLAVLPVHAIYAGFGLRESLVALTSILAVWWLTEVWHATGWRAWAWAVAAGLMGGLAILARNTALALAAAGGLYSLVAHGRRRLGPLLACGAVLTLTIAPWAWATFEEYGEPFYTYTKFFPYNFSWTVHHFAQGNTRASQFYTWENMPSIVRVKIKALVIIVIYSTMMVGVPIVFGLARRMRRRDGADTLVAWLAAAFVAGTLVNVADVTQVAQLGRYFLPLYALAIPSAVAGLRDIRLDPKDWLLASTAFVGLLWSDPTWAYDALWLVKPYQLHWPALRDCGEWVREHPDRVPPDARIMAWFPWEVRVASDRTTVLLPRNFYAPTIARAIDQYGVTHVLWGSFEPPPHSDPEAFGPYLERVRLGLGLTDEREVYRSPERTLYPVRLYRLRGGAP